MPNNILGYRAPGNQTMIGFEGRPLRGFEVIIGIGAFRAIRPLFNPMNNWFGRPTNNSEELECEFEYMQISTDDEILALSVDFDVSLVCSASCACHSNSNVSITNS